MRRVSLKCKKLQVSTSISKNLTTLKVLLTGVDTSFGDNSEFFPPNECKTNKNSSPLSSPLLSSTHLLVGMCFSLNSLEYNLSIAAANAPPSGWGWESRALKVVCISEGASEWAEARDWENVSMVTGLICSGVSCWRVTENFCKRQAGSAVWAAKEGKRFVWRSLVTDHV